MSTQFRSHAASAAGTFTTRRLSTLEDYKQCERLQSLMWGTGDVIRLSTLELVTAQAEGGLVLGAFGGESGERLVGFAYSILGLTSARELKHCSLLVGVESELQGRGIGFMLKLAQREAALEQGIGLMTWTFDPLLAPNAHLSFAKLGAVSSTYIDNAYGIGGGMNAAIETDRLLVDWQLDQPTRALPDEDPVRPLPPFDAELVNRPPAGAPDACPTEAADDLGHTARHLLIGIPARYDRIKRADLQLAQRWRMSLRRLLRHYLADGYRVIDFVSLGEPHDAQRAYLLERHA